MILHLIEIFLKITIFTILIWMAYQFGVIQNSTIEVKEVRAYTCDQVSHKFIQKDLKAYKTYKSKVNKVDI